MTDEEMTKIKIAFLSYITETYPHITDNGKLKHLKRFLKRLEKV